MKCLEEGIFLNDVVNLGNDNELTIKELGFLIKDTLNSPSNLVHLPARKEGDMTRRLPSIAKMKSNFKRELLPLRDGILKVAEGLIESGEIKESEIVVPLAILA